jgi:hypothetical protein
VSNFDEWFDGICEGRRDVLIEDKWMLARAAFDAGKADNERALVLLKAMCDMMKTLDDLHWLESIFDQTAVWDDAQCDGGCLYEEAKELLGIDY